MITAARFQNFQSHKNSLFEFCPTTNVIIGPSDAGKSTVVRGINWVTNNRPISNDFPSWWGGRALVELLTDDNQDIIRIEGNEKIYRVGTLTLKAFGTSVPMEVSNALRLEDVNIQQQGDSHFLLNSSSGDVAKYFNKIAKLEKINIGQQTVDKWIRGINESIAFKEEQLKKESDKLKEFEGLDKLEIDIEALEILEKESASIDRRFHELSKLIYNVESVDSKIASSDAILCIEEPLNSLLSLYEENRNLTKQINSISSLIEDLIEVNETIEEHTPLINAESKIKSILDLYAKSHAIEKRLDEYVYFLDNIGAVERSIKYAEEEYEKLHKQFEEEFPNICPLCNKPK